MDRNSRIAIVGAGAAGLSAAHYLRELGYHHIELFETESQVGGKCRTIEMDGALFDVGAVIATMGYNRVIELADHYGVPLTSAPKLFSKSIATGERNKLGLPPMQGLSAVKALYDFSSLLYRVRKTRIPGHTQFDFDLAKNVNEWLQEYNLENIREWLVPAFTGFGYGYKEFIPVAYLLKMCELTFANSLATHWNWFKVASRNAYRSVYNDVFKNHTFHAPDLMEPLMFERGYQSLFEAIAQGFDVRLSYPITEIAFSRDQKMLVGYDGENHEFDQVILATPPSVTSKLMKSDQTIQSLFELPNTLNYHTFLVDFEKPMDQEAWFITENTMHQSGMGRPVVVSRISPNSSTSTCYVYSDDSMRAQDLENNLEKDCLKLGLRLKAIRKQVSWNYFPHLDSDHFDQFYQTLERVQGRNGIYFTGEVANFTTVEHVVSYSQKLVNHFFLNSE